MAKHDLGSTKYPKIIEIVMQRLHKAGLQPKLISVDLVDKQPPDPSVGIQVGYEIKNYQIQLQAKEVEMFSNENGPAEKVTHSDFYSGRRANSLMGVFSALSIQPDTSVYLEAKGSKLIIHVALNTDVYLDDKE